MNKYQKIALILGALALSIVFGKTITKIGIGAMAVTGKWIIIVVATVLIVLFLKDAGRKK